jgi:hypothetical protein
MENLKRKIKKTLSLVIFSLFLLTINSCDNHENCCTIVDVDVSFHYKDKMGNNLINSNSEFDSSKIKVYFKNKDKFEFINRGNLTNSKMFTLHEDETKNLILTVFPSDYYEGNQSTTLIELNPNVVDTLLCEFELQSNRTICKRAWLNGLEIQNRYIEVEK